MENNIPIYIFSHNYLVNHWKEIVKEQLLKLSKSGLYGTSSRIFLGVYSDSDIDYEIFCKMISEFDISNKCIIERYSTNEREFFTLERLYDFSFNLEENAHILYYHTKGVTQTKTDTKESNIRWRHYLEHHNIECWERNIDVLKTHNIVGVIMFHCTHESDSGTMYVGNFWWANSSYIKNLVKINYEIYKNSNIYLEFWLFSATNYTYYDFGYDDFNDKKLGNQIGEIVYYNFPDYKDWINYNENKSVINYKKPKITISTRIRNMSEYIDILYTSLKYQTFDNWEWLIFDNHSEDDIKEKVPSFNGNIKLFHLENFMDFWKETSDKANGDIIIIVDADDFLRISALDHIYNIYKKTDFDLYIGNSYRFDDSDNNFIGYSNIHPFVFKKTGLQKVFDAGYNLETYYVDDFEICELVKIVNGSNYIMDDEATYFFRSNSNKSFSKNTGNFLGYDNLLQWQDYEKIAAEKIKNIIISTNYKEDFILKLAQITTFEDLKNEFNSIINIINIINKKIIIDFIDISFDLNENKFWISYKTPLDVEKKEYLLLFCDYCTDLPLAVNYWDYNIEYNHWYYINSIIGIKNYYDNFKGIRLKIFDKETLEFIGEKEHIVNKYGYDPNKRYFYKNKDILDIDYLYLLNEFYKL